MTTMYESPGSAGLHLAMTLQAVAECGRRLGDDAAGLREPRIGARALVASASGFTRLRTVKKTWERNIRLPCYMEDILIHNYEVLQYYNLFPCVFLRAAAIESARCCFRAAFMSAARSRNEEKKISAKHYEARALLPSSLTGGRQKALSHNIHLFSHLPTMPTFTPTCARQALRIASRRYPSSTFSRAPARTAGIARRHYVSETKPSNATVNVESAVKADQKAFFKETGNRPQDAVMPTTGLAADAMLSPTAGALCNPSFSSWHRR